VPAFQAYIGVRSCAQGRARRRPRDHGARAGRGVAGRAVCDGLCGEQGMGDERGGGSGEAVARIPIAPVTDGQQIERMAGMGKPGTRWRHPFLRWLPAFPSGGDAGGLAHANRRRNQVRRDGPRAELRKARRVSVQPRRVANVKPLRSSLAHGGDIAVRSSGQIPAHYLRFERTQISLVSLTHTNRG
jgi:hypothetical protein